MRRISSFGAGEFYGYAVERVGPVMLYFLSEGRNAWNSTWVSRYFSGCMHSSFDDARFSAERRRVQGTVFVVEELPAIEFRAREGGLLVTLINHHNPFQVFASRAGGNYVQGNIGRCASKPDTLQHAMLKFDLASLCWRSLRTINKNNLHFLWAEPSELNNIGRLPTRKLRAWSSFSEGADLTLSWSRFDSWITPRPTHRLVRNFLSNSSN